MLGKEAVCVGTVLGGREPMLRLVNRIMGYFIRYPFRSVEQGIINRLLHKEGDPVGTHRGDVQLRQYIWPNLEVEPRF
jgi:hypothetical protein